MRQIGTIIRDKTMTFDCNHYYFKGTKVEVLYRLRNEYIVRNLKPCHFYGNLISAGIREQGIREQEITERDISFTRESLNDWVRKP